MNYLPVNIKSKNLFDFVRQDIENNGRFSLITHVQRALYQKINRKIVMLGFHLHYNILFHQHALHLDICVPPVINLDKFYEFSMFLWTKHLFEAKTPPERFKTWTEHFSKAYETKQKFQLFLCYPELYVLYPKQLTLIWTESLQMLKVLSDRINDSEWPYFVPIFLPNGEEVVSVKQTQEFFNRQT